MSPASASTRPSSTATACTRWRDSTTVPRRTSTAIGSTARVYGQPWRPAVDEWAANPVWSGLVDHSLTIPDYESLDTMVVSEPAQLRALGDDIRTKIVALLRDRAASTTELAAKLGIPKGTAGHHLKVLERAGLVKVVRTRKVRAVTERYYGRVARLFLIRCDEDERQGRARTVHRRDLSCARRPTSSPPRASSRRRGSSTRG